MNIYEFITRPLTHRIMWVNRTTERVVSDHADIVESNRLCNPHASATGVYTFTGKTATLTPKAKRSHKKKVQS